MIRIIVDSTCDLPAEIMKEYGIETVPLRILLNGKEFLDKVSIKVSQVYEAMRGGIQPKTSQPNPVDAYNTFYKHAVQGCSMIFLSFSGKMSGTYQVISAVGQQIKEQFPAIDLAVIDTKAGSMATGLMAWQAAKLAAAGRSFTEIVRTVEELVKQVEHIFTITDLQWLVKGGRITKAEGLLGSILHIKPILHVNDGMIEPLEKVRGKKKALCTMVNILEEKIAAFPEQVIGISHADDEETALELEALIKERLGEKRIISSIIGSVLGSHLGIGGVGVFFFRQRPSLYIP